MTLRVPLDRILGLRIAAAGACVAALSAAPRAVTAGVGHPGHGSKVVLGTLKEVAKDAIVVEVLDPAAGGTSRVRVLLQEDTRYRIDKERLASIEGLIGQRAIVSVDWEDDDRGGQTLRATQVRFTRKK
jgi:hypothetical protein